jgi:hypothetical protein
MAPAIKRAQPTLFNGDHPVYIHTALMTWVARINPLSGVPDCKRTMPISTPQRAAVLSTGTSVIVVVTAAAVVVTAAAVVTVAVVVCQKATELDLTHNSV